MKWLSNIFFYGYVFLLIVAGAWGACFAAQLDHNVLFNLDVQTLAPKTAASLLSQYRFLRAIEFGFGIFAFLFRREIFSNPKFNRVFLATMLLGVVARIISFILYQIWINRLLIRRRSPLSLILEKELVAFRSGTGIRWSTKRSLLLLCYF